MPTNGVRSTFSRKSTANCTADTGIFKGVGRHPKTGKKKHHARIVTYVDEEKYKLISLLTNDMDLDPEEIVAIYRKRWEIELLFKQMKQNFPLKYFYGKSANAIKIQI